MTRLTTFLLSTAALALSACAHGGLSTAPQAAAPVAEAVAPVAVAAPATPAPALEAADAPGRLIPLEGGQNFRELGGYRTADGRHVRTGLIYRSGSMTHLTPADFAALGERNIRTVVDFRDNRERAAEPVVWPESVAPIVLVGEDISSTSDEFVRTLMAPDNDGPRTRAMMAHFYRDIPFRYAPQYRVMFAQLLEQRAPLVFNCSAGKDRTGIAAALLLTALGVSRETVVEDYLLSNRHFNPRRLTASANDDPQAAFYRNLPPEVLQALMSVDRSYIESAFAAIEARPGGLDAYYRDQLGLDAAAIERLRSLYLQ